MLATLTKGKAMAIALGMLMNEDDIRCKLYRKTTAQQLESFIATMFGLSRQEAASLDGSQLITAGGCVTLGPRDIQAFMTSALSGYSGGACPSVGELFDLASYIANHQFPPPPPKK